MLNPRSGGVASTVRSMRKSLVVKCYAVSDVESLVQGLITVSVG